MDDPTDESDSDALLLVLTDRLDERIVEPESLTDEEMLCDDDGVTVDISLVLSEDDVVVLPDVLSDVELSVTLLIESDGNEAYLVDDERVDEQLLESPVVERDCETDALML